MKPTPRIPEGFVPELIAVDVDDTLVDHRRGVSERVVESIARVRAAGIAVTIATGRTPSTTIPVAQAAGIGGLIVCSNGALLVDSDDESTVEARTFDPRPVLDELIVHVPNAIFAVENSAGMFRTTRMFTTGPLAMSVREVSFEQLFDEPIVRLVVRSEQHLEEGFGPIVEKLGYQSVIYGVADVAWLDIGPKGVNKATMLDRLCAVRGFDPARTIAIGDSWNDMSMLAWAGLGVAMDTAPPAVKDVADTVTSGIPGEGVADVLDALVV